MMSLQRQPWVDGSSLIIGAFVNFSFLASLVFFALMREQPAFWTNAGDWPIWLRELVGATFYPLLLLELLLLTVFSAVCVRSLRSGDPTITPSVLLLPILWTLLILVLVIVGSNNLENLIAGRPLHWHPL